MKREPELGIPKAESEDQSPHWREPLESGGREPIRRSLPETHPEPTGATPLEGRNWDVEESQEGWSEEWPKTGALSSILSSHGRLTQWSREDGR